VAFSAGGDGAGALFEPALPGRWPTVLRKIAIIRLKFRSIQEIPAILKTPLYT
jgi:hypothetical protein